MNIPLITWLCIALAMILIVIVRVFLSAHERQMNKQQHVSNTTHRKLFGIGSEREEFFVPGDRLPDSIDYYGDDDN
ncbi:MAG: hypothetical protein J6A20_07360 [Muribaculaceae bacterium]|nr:hypothetical protein [Muribaculaceae bacterium]